MTSESLASVYVNQTTVINIDANTSTIVDVLARLNIELKSMAVAVNNQIVTQDKWATYRLNNNDNVNIFAAIAGG